MDIADLGTILSIWAHPDDETYLAGGIMTMARQRGQAVVCVSATAGEHGTDDPATWPPERLGRVRRAEAAAAMGVLGVDDHRWLGFEDGCLAGVDPQSGIEQVVALIDDVSPDTILTFGPDGMTFHPDHVAIHAWVTQAWTRRDRSPTLLYAAAEAEHRRRWGDRLEAWGVYMTDERPVPVEAGALALHVSLTGPVLDRKLAALSAMPSQVGPATARLSAGDFRMVNSHEAFVAA
ncbi:MAG TPA: PIG-L family deacetylase [Acidimicrobiales bacterium]|nr:PIG-L family deacetylase [Acidimicrobiales bacterium]